MRRYVGTALVRSGHTVDTSPDGEEGWWLVENKTYDVLILDIMLPGLDGLAMLRRLRNLKRSDPVLLLTAKDAIEDRVRGLNEGADDYLVKPFALEELLARVEALGRRRYQHSTSRLEIGDLKIDLSAKTVLRGNEALELTAKEFKVLECLALRQGQVVSRSEIEDCLYDDSAELMSNAVDSTICLLRKKIAASGGSVSIHTRRGLGYVIGAPS